MKKNTYKIWFSVTLFCAVAGILGFALINIIVDPFFHYHKPIRYLSYPINNERYQNDGIMRNFSYDSIITGTSMTENFKSSEFDELFQANSIKVAFEGASFREIGDRLRTALESGNDIKYILRCLDTDYLIMDKDLIRTDLGTYPDYLYDDKVLNDVNYVLNKDVLVQSVEVLLYTLEGRETTSFDEYKNWNRFFEFGAKQVLATYERKEILAETVQMTEEERQTIRENIQQNVSQLAEDYPDTEFLLYLAPYSICWWENSIVCTGKLQWEIEAQRIVIDELLKYDNIRLYSFFLNGDLICNLDNYKDTMHYGEWVNSQILEWIHDDEYRLTKKNYKMYLKTLEEFYGNYDYDILHR